MLRRAIARLTNIQDIARKHVGVIVEQRCRCPFHKGPNPTMVLNSKKGTYKCEVCGESGDTFNLAMKLEGWTYFEAYQKLAGRLRHVEKGIVYVLELADGCYYVGYTLDLVNRLNLHFNGKGAYWTKQHAPIKLVDVYYDVTYATEDLVTEQYFEWFGKDKVRGGRYVGADLDVMDGRE